MYIPPSEPRRLACVGMSAIAALAAFAAAPAAAQDSAVPAPLAPLKACQGETDPAARLACFDRVAAEMLAASEAGDLRVVDREEIKKTRRGLFGFNLPDFGIFGRDDDDEDEAEEEGFDVLNTTIASVSGNHAVGYIITTAEGAVWKTDESPTMSPKTGQPIEIRNAALTSYSLRINGQRGVKGRRIR